MTTTSSAAHLITAITAPGDDTDFDDQPSVAPLPHFEPHLGDASASPPVISYRMPTPTAATTRPGMVLEFPVARMREPTPDPTQWARGIIQATLEALNGARAPGQLQRWFAPRVHAALVARAACGRRATAVPPKITVRSVRTVSVGEGRVEAVGVVEVAGRCRAVALRMQTYDGRWRVTALEIG